MNNTKSPKASQTTKRYASQHREANTPKKNESNQNKHLFQAVIIGLSNILLQTDAVVKFSASDKDGPKSLHNITITQIVDYDSSCQSDQMSEHKFNSLNNKNCDYNIFEIIENTNNIICSYHNIYDNYNNDFNYNCNQMNETIQNFQNIENIENNHNVQNIQNVQNQEMNQMNSNKIINQNIETEIQTILQTYQIQNISQTSKENIIFNCLSQQLQDQMKQIMRNNNRNEEYIEKMFKKGRERKITIAGSQSLKKYKTFGLFNEKGIEMFGMKVMEIIVNHPNQEKKNEKLINLHLERNNCDIFNAFREVLEYEECVTDCGKEILRDYYLNCFCCLNYLNDINETKETKESDDLDGFNEIEMNEFQQIIQLDNQYETSETGQTSGSQQNVNIYYYDSMQIDSEQLNMNSQFNQNCQNEQSNESQFIEMVNQQNDYYLINQMINHIRLPESQYQTTYEFYIQQNYYRNQSNNNTNYY